MKPISLLMNLAPLGGTFKTGIYRVADELVKGMAADGRVDLSVHSLRHTARSHRYFREDLSGSGVSLSPGPLATLRERVSGGLNQFFEKSSSSRSIASRARRKGVVLAEEMIDSLSFNLSTELLRATRIYHSPFGIIPKKVRRHPHVKRFTSIYDLIPITHPEFFEMRTVRPMRRLIESLDEEDHVSCISEASRRALLEHSRVKAENAHVVPLAAASHFFPVENQEDKEHVLERYGIGPEGYILSLCTLEVRKNVELVIRAFVRLHSERRLPQGTRLVLVGEKGWKTKNFEAALESAGEFRNLIVMPGFVPDEDLAAVYSGARLFAYMSFAEGFGLPPLEAMQCGIPVVTSNTTSLPEVVADAGVALDPTNLEGLCEAIQRLFEDEAHHLNLCQKSLNRSACFSWERYIDQTIECYQKALDSKAP